MRHILNFSRAIRRLFFSRFFGFVRGHDYLSKEDLTYLESLIGKNEVFIVDKYEAEFEKNIGAGKAISFASGRMAFYAILSILNISKGDEVLILGATCSVMVNAINRVGATPIFYDIDPQTFGSSIKAIMPLLSTKVKMVVVQHSFGIPCEIFPIVEILKKRKIFLLEDCALTFGSKYRGKVCGDFGDASIFSTDHSKPINTMIGGIAYSKDSNLLSRLKIFHSNCAELSLGHQQRLFNQIKFESKYAKPRHYFWRVISILIRKISRAESPFLDAEFAIGEKNVYPYPAKMPVFLAALGLIELARWGDISNQRILALKKIVELTKKIDLISLPSVYYETNRSIIPLRIAWYSKDGLKIRENLSQFLDVDWIWFMEPIVALKSTLLELGYRKGACPVSEEIGAGIINIPCNLNNNEFDIFLKILKRKLIDSG